MIRTRTGEDTQNPGTKEAIEAPTPEHPALWKTSNFCLPHLSVLGGGGGGVGAFQGFGSYEPRGHGFPEPSHQIQAGLKPTSNKAPLESQSTLQDS